MTKSDGSNARSSAFSISSTRNSSCRPEFFMVPRANTVNGTATDWWLGARQAKYVFWDLDTEGGVHGGGHCLFELAIFWECFPWRVHTFRWVCIAQGPRLYCNDFCILVRWLSLSLKLVERLKQLLSEKMQGKYIVNKPFQAARLTMGHYSISFVLRHGR